MLREGVSVNMVFFVCLFVDSKTHFPGEPLELMSIQFQVVQLISEPRSGKYEGDNLVQAHGECAFLKVNQFGGRDVLHEGGD